MASRRTPAATARTHAIPPRGIRSYAGDPFLVWLFDRIDVRPYRLGMMTFCLGFGTLTIWYSLMIWTRDPAAHLKGLYAYYTATFGDSLVLPPLSVLIATSYRTSEHLFKGATPREKAAIRRVYEKPFWSLLTMAAAALAIWRVYIAPIQPLDINWTSPGPGQLNAPGWYHALFMGIQLYLVWGYVVRAGITLILATQHPRLVGRNRSAWVRDVVILVGIEVLLGCFSGLLVLDRVGVAASWPVILAAVSREPAILALYGLGLPLCAARFVVSRPAKAEPWVARALGSALLISGSPIVTPTLVSIVQRLLSRIVRTLST